MAVRFVLGRAGTGKTRYCLDAILAELDRPTGEHPLLLIVPEQASFQMERALAARSARRGYSRAEVLSFSRLATRVFDQFGGGPAELTPQSRVLALRAIAASEPAGLSAFGSAARTQGFFDRVARLIEELLRENVSSQSLLTAATALADKDSRARVKAVATLLTRYLEMLGTDRSDPAHRLMRLRERLAEATWLHDAAVWVDGFAGFTGQESETLIALAGMARSLEITLLLDPVELLRPGAAPVPDEPRLFHRTEQTYGLLRQALLSPSGTGPEPTQGAQPARCAAATQHELFPVRGVSLRSPVVLTPEPPPRFSTAAGIAALERAFVRGPADSQSSAIPAGGVRVLSCDSHRSELRQAARFIRRSIIESGGGLRFRDFAIIARNLESFHRLIGESLREFEIPYFLDRRRSLSGHALIRFARDVLNAARRDAPLPLMLRLLQSGLLPFSRNTCERLENLALAREPVGLTAWRDAIDDSLSNDLRDARQRIVEALAHLVACVRDASAADSTRDSKNAAALQPTASEWCAALLSSLESLRVRDRLTDWILAARAAERWDEAETHRLAWDAFCGVLDDIAGVLGGTRLSADDFAAIVESALEESTLALAPPTVDQVLVSSIERSRHPEIKHAWLFAFNEGIFPAQPADDAILSDAERSALIAAGLRAPAPARQDAFGERLLAYIAATRPSCSLTISFSRFSAGGDDMFPSPLLADLHRALPSIEIESPTPDEPPLTLSEFAEMALMSKSPAPRVSKTEQELRRDATASDALDRLLRGRGYQNAAPPIARRTTPDQNGYLWYGSPSELEVALQCPFRRFASYSLRIEERRGPKPVEWELASIAHAVIAAVCTSAIAKARQIRDVTDENWAKLVREEFSRAANANPGPPELSALLTALEPFVLELTLAHAARWRRGRFNLLATEDRFGEIQSCDRHPALRMDLPGVGQIGLHGVVDRLDGYRDESGVLHLLIYDYKSSAKPVRQPYLTGERLQIMTYLLACAQAFGGEGSPATTAGAFLAPLYPTRAAIERARCERDEATRRMILYRPAGVFDRRVAEALDEGVGTAPSPVANMRLKKDGGFYSSCDARPPAEIAARIDLARRTIIQTAGAIIAGNVDVTPLVEGRRLACGTCAYQSICRFDTVFNRPRAAERVLPVLAMPSPDDAEASA